MAEQILENLDDKHLSQLQDFENWIAQQKKLPQNNDKIVLRRFLSVYGYNDLKKSQDLFIYNLSIRKNAPHLFRNRDVTSDEVQSAIKVMQFCPMPKLTAEKCKTTILRLANEDISQFYYVNVIKMALMTFDTRFTMYDDDDRNIATGEIFVIDGKGFSFRHFLEVARHIKTVRIYMKYIQEAAPFNIKGIHFVNCSTVLDKAFSLIKPLMKKEVLSVIHFHTSGLDSFHQYVPLDCLPAEYGGVLGSIDDLHRTFSKIIEAKRSYLMNDNNWKIAESD